MLNIKDIRNNPDHFQRCLDKRNFTDIKINDLLRKDEQLRILQTNLQALQEERNKTAKIISKATPEERPSLIQKGEAIKKEMLDKESKVKELKDDFDCLISSIPNILHDSVPLGKDENDNVEVRKIGEPKKFNFQPKEHHELSISKEMMDFEASAKVSGARFVYLKGEIAKLHRALGQFFLDTLTQEFGYTELLTPYLVKTEAMFGTGQLPKFEEDQFETTDGRWLIPTSEVSLTNYVREKILQEKDFPHRFTTLSPCFRKEAGSAGKDMHGMIRQHQFYKTEMVSITKADESYEELERMVTIASTLLERLELPHRIVTLCSGDIGFGAAKTYDLEVWLPSQNCYREISSCSNCEDFQARRMKTRYKTSDGENLYCHTLNGSGLAVGRALVAVLENYQKEDGTIDVPKVLH